jgi:hypothetical protein
MRQERSPAPLRVFVSHTSELDKLPKDGSFVAAAKAGILQAGHVAIEMQLFSAFNGSSAQMCVDHLGRTDVYVLIAGFRYGSLATQLASRRPRRRFSAVCAVSCCLSRGSGFITLSSTNVRQAAVEAVCPPPRPGHTLRAPRTVYRR